VGHVLYRTAVLLLLGAILTAQLALLHGMQRRTLTFADLIGLEERDRYDLLGRVPIVGVPPELGPVRVNIASIGGLPVTLLRGGMGALPVDVVRPVDVGAVHDTVDVNIQDAVDVDIREIRKGAGTVNVNVQKVAGYDVPPTVPPSLPVKLRDR